MSDADVLVQVMALERKKEALRKADIDPALKLRLMKELTSQLATLTHETLSEAAPKKS